MTGLEPGNTYYWKVVATNTANRSTTGPLWSFNVLDEKPFNPYPSDGSSITYSDTTLSWQCNSPENVSLTYNLYFGAGELADPVAEGLSTDSYYVSDLATGTTYYWKVVAQDSTGISTEGPKWSFSTNMPPHITDLSPKSGTMDATVTVTLSWTGNDPDGNSLSYDLYFSQDSSPTMLESNLSETEYSFAVSPLEHNITVYGKVVAVDDVGGSTESEVYYFSTPVSDPPAIESMSPATGSDNIPLNSYLTWICSDINGEDLTYDVYLGLTDSPTLLASGLEVSSYLLPGFMEYETTYYWKLVVSDGHGGVAESEVYSFTTERNSLPVIDSMTPTDTATGVSRKPTLAWDCHDENGDSLSYDLYFGTTSLPTKIASAMSSDSYTFAEPLSPLTTYYWMVSVNDGSGSIVQSQVYTFLTRANSLPVIENMSPSSGSVAAVDTLFSWNVSDEDYDSLSFDLYFGEEPDPTLIATGLTGISYQLPNILTPATVYYWKLVATDGKGLTTSEICEFRTSVEISYAISKYGGGDSDVLLSSVLKTDQGYVSAGYAKSIALPDYHGGGDMWIVSLDAAGKTLWQKCFGGSNEERAEDIKQTSDGGYIVAGWTRSINGDVGDNNGNADAWIVKLASDGTIIWENNFGGSKDDFAKSIVEVSDGGYLLAGSTNSSNGDVSGNHGDRDAWIVKLDSGGNISWQKCFGGGSYDEFYSVLETTDGAFVAAGKTDSVNGDVSKNNGMSDAWIVEIDTNGAIIWEHSFGGTGSETAYTVQETIEGGFVFAGYTQSSDLVGFRGYRDAWVVKMSSAGILDWQKCLGGTNIEEFFGVQTTSGNGYILSGYSFSQDGDVTENKGICDAWVVKLNSGGSIAWQKSLGGTSNDYANSICEITPGKYLSAGNTSSNNGDMPGGFGSTDGWIGIFEE